MTKQCYLGQGLIAFKPTELRGARTNDIAALLLKMKKDLTVKWN